MSQTVLEQTVTQTQTQTQTQTLTLKFDATASTSNPQPGSKTPNPPDSTSEPKPDEPTTVENDPASSVAIPIPNNLDPHLHAMVNEFLMQNSSSDEEVRTNARNNLRSYIEREEVAIATLLALVIYASDANVTDLFDIVCERVADLIKDKPVEEIREIFNIINDYTPEEEQAVRDEYPWAFED